MAEILMDCHSLGLMYPTRSLFEAAWAANRSKANTVLRCWTTKKSKLFKSFKDKATGHRVFKFDGKIVIWAEELSALASPIPNLLQRASQDGELILMNRRSSAATLTQFLNHYCVVGKQGVRETLISEWRRIQFAHEKEQCRHYIEKLQAALEAAESLGEQEGDDDVDEDILFTSDDSPDTATTAGVANTRATAVNTNPAQSLCESAVDTFKHLSEFVNVATKQQRDSTALHQSTYSVARASLQQMEMLIRSAKVCTLTFSLFVHTHVYIFVPVLVHLYIRLYIYIYI
jgi:hypothetical protein